MQFHTICMLLASSFIFSQNTSSSVPYPNFSNLVPKSPTPAPFTSPAPTTPTPGLNETSTPAPTCSLYDSKLRVEYDVQQGCQSVASSKSPSGLIACELLEDITDLLKSCVDKNAFEQQFIELVTTKMSSFSSSDGWQVYGIGIPFEPYTFEGVQLYYPYQNNVDIVQSDNFLDIMDSYNFYTDCVSSFGDACTFYHAGKLATFYEQSGGAWLLELERQIDGYFMTFEAFFAPIIIDGRFFGLLEAEVFHD
eukprot:TRINITY_DN4343_c0_g1_i4.p1 TRINITY_DN4343_c0_g1~~TRINITY_DN4343_c0_g1_i4.p1  ORF type:complete len:251 (-),score=34.05 TRINITY_DN4343_c0_g1_i4:289-1041(-)